MNKPDYHQHEATYQQLRANGFRGWAKNLLLMAFVGIIVTACSSAEYDQNDWQHKAAMPTPKPSPKPCPTPTPKPDPKFLCRISNGEGRIFKGLDESRFKAETKARHECELFSRHCNLLGCAEQEPE